MEPFAGLALGIMMAEWQLIYWRRPMAGLAKGILSLHERINYRGHIETQRNIRRFLVVEGQPLVT